MKSILKVLLPLLVLALGVSSAYWLIKTTPKPKRRPKPKKPPMVRVVTAKKVDYRYWIKAQGTVRPRTETALVPEVSGRVVKVSPALASGGYFEANDLLLEIDPTDYRLTVVQRKAQVAKAKANLATIQAQANVAYKEWKSMGNGFKPSSLVLKEPQVAEAKAALASAKAALEQAKLNLERTKIKAPFAGRVRDEKVDLGQYVSKGAQLASIYAVDYAEVRLPLPDNELAFVNLPLSYRGGLQRGEEPLVKLSAWFAGKKYAWQGRIVRTEGEIDSKSRMVVVVAQVKDPYAQKSDIDSPPLASGMFVQAEIQGKFVKNVFVLPRGVLENADSVVLLDKQNRLHWQKVKILRLEDENVVIGQGLKSGQRICLTRPKVVVENMTVAVFGDKKQPQNKARKNRQRPKGGKAHSK